MQYAKCRFCNAVLQHSFCNLGHSPLSNAYLTELNQKATLFPLHAYVCSGCLLVQLPAQHAPEEIFSEYAYFSSFSSSWLEHCKSYAQKMIQRFQLSHDSQVIEVASNDGYLLQYFKEKHIPVLGIEPAQNVAKSAQNKGIPTLTRFFGIQLASEMQERADLLIGNNVLAHVPDLNDFVAALKRILKPHGVITMEFPHLLRLMEENQFDTIYHEHFSYFSFLVVKKIFAALQLDIFDVELLPTHGGSLRIYIKHTENQKHKICDTVQKLLAEEKKKGLNQLKTYLSFSQKVEIVKKELVYFLEKAQKENKRVAAYGAPAKGNTLLNYCELSSKSIPFTVDRNPYKQGKFLPGTHIPIYAPEKIQEFRPDYLLILPWNLKNEIINDMQGIRKWGGKFVLPIPKLEIFA